MIDISCVLIKNIYQDTGYNVALFKDINASKTFTAVGASLPSAQGPVYILTGETVRNQKYGKQFKVTTYRTMTPKTSSGIVRYLTALRVKGVGEATAKRLVKAFGRDVFDIMKNDPMKLTTVFGVSRKKAEAIHKSYISKEKIKNLIEYLDEMGLPTSKAVAIDKQFEGSVDYVATFKEHPYLLCRVDGLSFAQVDKAVRENGEFDATCGERLMFGVIEVMKQSEKKGDTFITPDKAAEDAMKLLGIDNHAAKDAINLMVKRRDLAYEGGALWLSQTLKAEKMCAERLIELSHANVEYRSNEEVEKAIGLASAVAGITLADMQKEAIRSAMANSVSVITGGPGSGKTTTINTLLKTYQLLFKDKKIVLCAPTGRAARRMTESSGMDSRTMHSVLGLNADSYELTRSEDEMLDADLVIADEFSMCDVYLSAVFFNSIKKGTRVIMVGDKDQLPSVRCGNVFQEVIASEVIPTTRLNVTFRQAQDSAIIENAYRINNNNMPLRIADDFRIIDARDDDEIVETTKKCVQANAEMYGLDNIMVISPLRKRESIGSNALNNALQDIFNPPSAGKAETKTSSGIWREMDRVMYVKNEGEVCNGDVGKIVRAIPFGTDEEDKGVEVKYESGVSRVYDISEMEHLQHAFASTVHKTQGAEYPCVIVVFPESVGNFRMRNLLYTAVTRASKKVIVIGSMNSIAFASARTGNKRNTYMAWRLIQEEKGVNKKWA